MKRFIFKNFPVSSHLHDLCNHHRTWSFQYNRDNACRWNVFSSSMTKRKCHKSRFRTFKFKSVLNSVSTTCTCNKFWNFVLSVKLFIRWHRTPLLIYFKYKSCISFKTQWSNYIFTSTGRDHIESTISTGELNGQRIL